MAQNKANTSSYEKVMKDASKEGKSIFFNFAKTYPAYILLIITIIGSVFVRSFVKNNVENDLHASFDKAANSVLTRLNQTYQSDLQIVTSMQALFEKTYLDRGSFELNSSVPVSTNNSILNINYARRVTRANLNEFTYGTKSQGYFNFVLHPDNKKDPVYPVEFVYPLEANADKSGYDFGENEYFSKHILKSIEEGIVISSEFHNIRKDTLGFHLAAPVYIKDMPKGTLEERKKNFSAFIIMEIDAKKFFDGIFSKGIASDSTIIVEILDEANGKENNIFSSFNAGILKTGHKPVLTETQNFKLANRNLKLKYATVPDFGGAMQVHLPNLAFAGSLITSFVLFGFVMSVITSRARAVDLAERITRDQRRIVDSSQDVIAMLDLNGTWKSMNPASFKIFGIDHNEMIDTSINNLFFDEVGYQFFNNLQSNPEAEFTERVDLQMKNTAGEMRWVNWSFTVSKVDHLIYSIGRDVTLEKLAEQEAAIRNKQIMLAEQFAREASESKSYFMTKLGHQIRNSLTGIVGYLQLVSGKVYETEEELESYVGLAEESTDELFTFVSDLVDRSQQEDAQSNVNIMTTTFEHIKDMAYEKIPQNITSGVVINVNYDDAGKTARIVADSNIVSEALVKVYDALSSGLAVCNFDIVVTENPYEGATEIQIIGTENNLVEDLIKIYKDNKNHIIEALKYDKRDILLDLAIVESNIRRMNGTMNVETLGKDGNIVMLTLPLTKSHE